MSKKQRESEAVRGSVQGSVRGSSRKREDLSEAGEKERLTVDERPISETPHDYLMKILIIGNPGMEYYVPFL
jgi:hypothetical protein